MTFPLFKVQPLQHTEDQGCRGCAVEGGVNGARGALIRRRTSSLTPQGIEQAALSTETANSNLLVCAGASPRRGADAPIGQLRDDTVSDSRSEGSLASGGAALSRPSWSASSKPCLTGLSSASFANNRYVYAVFFDGPDLIHVAHRLIEASHDHVLTIRD